MPDELVNRGRRVVETVLIQTPDHLGDGPVEPRFDPAVGDRFVLPANDGMGRVILQIHHREPGRVPDLVDEILVALDPLFRHPDIPSLGGEGGERKAKGVRPERSIISRGSMLFPLDLLIFSPFSSRTRAWR